jgi:hypothetical protein
LFAAVVSETAAPILPAELVSTLTTLGASFGVDTTGLSDPTECKSVSPADARSHWLGGARKQCRI